MGRAFWRIDQRRNFSLGEEEIDHKSLYQLIIIEESLDVLGPEVVTGFSRINAGS